ncbi:GntR family transcriptional regulator [Wenyingzhuangia sp. IMCC45533]
MSLEFNNNKAIYLQIADSVCDKILTKVFENNTKISSIRQIAVELEVNPNTVQRSYEWLQQHQIIYTKRGLGYFTHQNAYEKVIQLRKQEFIEEVLPQVFKNMDLLNVHLEDLQKGYQQYLNQKKHENEL